MIPKTRSKTLSISSQLAHQGPVALLEDVQRSDHSREHHRVEREQRHLGHVLNLVPYRSPPSACRAGL